jgi:uncharacterized protein YjgD (DUF1641 family)
MDLIWAIIKAFPIARALINQFIVEYQKKILEEMEQKSAKQISERSFLIEKLHEAKSDEEIIAITRIINKL